MHKVMQAERRHLIFTLDVMESHVSRIRPCYRPAVHSHEPHGALGGDAARCAPDAAHLLCLLYRFTCRLSMSQPQDMGKREQRVLRWLMQAEARNWRRRQHSDNLRSRSAGCFSDFRGK